MGIRVPPGVPLRPLLWQGFLLFPVEPESLGAFVGPRLGREVSGPDVIEVHHENRLDGASPQLSSLYRW